MKVLHIITGLTTGGAERMLVKIIASTMNEIDHTVISIRGIGKQGEVLKKMGVKVYDLNVGNYLLFPFRYLKLKEMVKSIEPDLIQGWMYHGNVAASLSKNKSTPVLHNVRQTVYSFSDEKLLNQVIIKINALLSAKANLVLFNSKKSLDQHVVRGFNKENTYYIANGFDINKYQKNDKYRLQIRDELKLSDDATLIVQVGRNHPMKDHFNFLKAAKLVSEKKKSVHFLIVGREVSEDKELRNFIVSNELNNRVTLWGERSDIDRIWNAADFGVLSSSWGEGFPNVIGEAMACETPCIATDVGDSVRVVGDAGLIVPPKNELELSKAILTFCNLDKKKVESLKKKARYRIVNNFSIESISNEYLEIYKRFKFKN